MAILLFGACVGAIVGMMGEDDGYVGGLSACAEFRRLAHNIGLGILTDAEIREELIGIQKRASTAEPAINAAATDMLRKMTQGDIEGLLQAIEDMASACVEAGY